MPKVVDHDARRLAFAEAAFRVIAKRGFARVTMRAVADEAGFTTGALVHYFKSKDHLLIEASEHVARVMRARFDRSAASRRGLDALRQVLYDALPTTPEMRGMWNVWLGFWDRATRSPTVRRITALRYQEWQDRIAALVIGAQKTGEVSRGIDPVKEALCIISLIDGIGARVLLTGGELPAGRQRELVDALIDSLRTMRPQTIETRRKRARGQRA